MENGSGVEMAKAASPLRVRDLYKELGEARLQALSQEFYDRVYGALKALISVFLATLGGWRLTLRACLRACMGAVQRMTRSRGSGTCLW
jgi:truncated hemoglobin YjbI